jgi:hypothetical protein
MGLLGLKVEKFPTAPLGLQMQDSWLTQRISAVRDYMTCFNEGDIRCLEIFTPDVKVLLAADAFGPSNPEQEQLVCEGTDMLKEAHLREFGGGGDNNRKLFFSKADYGSGDATKVLCGYANQVVV